MLLHARTMTGPPDLGDSVAHTEVPRPAVPYGRGPLGPRLIVHRPHHRLWRGHYREVKGHYREVKGHYREVTLEKSLF